MEGQARYQEELRSNFPDPHNTPINLNIPRGPFGGMEDPTGGLGSSLCPSLMGQKPR